jgi:hypothetical protein
MIDIKSFKILGYCYQITVVINGEVITGKTYFDYDGHDKIDIDGKTYELVGLSYIREV